MLELTHLSKRYDGFDFGPVDLSVDDEVLAVLGPSGSGKSTLLSLVAGLVVPDDGSVALDGRSLVGRPPEARGVGLVFQDGALFPHMTARENVAYAADRPGRVDELAARLELDDVLDRRPSSLSGGERQRVALARTLAADPDVLLLDEPLSSLDAPIRRRLRDELYDLFDSLSVPIVYVTHDQRAAAALGDRIAVLRDGSVEQVDDPTTVLRRPATRFVAEFTGSETVFEATVSEDGRHVGTGDVTLRTDADPPPGSVVTCCVRPSRVELMPATDGGVTPDEADGANALPGRVRRWVNESDAYRVVVDVDGTDVALTATVPPTTFERLGLDTGSRVRAAIPPAALHVIPE
ncbi:ABC transporter ATP-binding protein [Haloarchaeobius sp. HRN-SO-5]|uniref:ABC transporter ATP-binding protein n=1 Tax=Haloarchaeobius sp. HRN-SO-5 TaxID=3446118 RepID=UPI003EBFD3B2